MEEESPQVIPHCTNCTCCSHLHLMS